MSKNPSARFPFEVPGVPQPKNAFGEILKLCLFNWSKNAPKTALFKTLKRDILDSEIDYEEYNEICAKCDQELE